MGIMSAALDAATAPTAGLISRRVPRRRAWAGHGCARDRADALPLLSDVRGLWRPPAGLVGRFRPGEGLWEIGLRANHRIAPRLRPRQLKALAPLAVGEHDEPEPVSRLGEVGTE